jgi:uncharacterized protein with von Willebrand factor type A (vWA) domain
VTWGREDPGGPAPADLAGQFQENLVRFVRVLRHLGLAVNPAETLDALAALELVDLADRATVRAALRATLVKEAGRRDLFERAFDLFFARPEDRQALVAERRLAAEARQRLLAQAGAEIVFQGRPLALSPEQLETYTRLGRIQQEHLLDFLAGSSAGNRVDHKFQPLIESIVRGHLDRLRREAGRERRPQTEPTGDESLDSVIESLLSGPTDASTGRLLHLDMKDITGVDLTRATHLIRRLACRLATRLSRRYRESPKHRRPDMRRTIRSNIRHGGSLFDLRFRDRRTAKPRLLLLCDVSGSMACYTAFTLEFIFGLGRAVRGVEAFVFSEKLARVTDLAARSPGLLPDLAARDLIEGSRVWGQGTDLGTALDTLLAEHGRHLTRSTIVIVVSDTKSLGAAQAARALARLRPKVRGILWLNTLPRAEWGEHRTVALFSAVAAMHECYTLAHLERVIRRGVVGGRWPV